MEGYIVNFSMDIELRILWVAIVAYVVAGCVAIGGVILERRPERAVLMTMVCGLVLHMVSLGMRWVRLDHGPFVTMFEILSSNLWSLTLVFSVAYWRFPPLRPTAAIILPILFIMMGWLVLENPGGGHFPPTYHTPWLYVHVGLGKVFLGAVLVAVGLSVVILLRAAKIGLQRLSRLPTDEELDDLAYRFMALGFVFDSLMLVAGAIWAQDAWGRYWAWDRLETWSFITWLLLAFALHSRYAFRMTLRANAWMTVMVFAVAFLTFFGIPFISTTPHRGAV